MNAHTDFFLKADVPIIIYGAGEVGKQFGAHARREGYNVVAFFDKKLVGKQCDGLPVLDYSSSVPVGLNKKNIVVVICLADGLLHKDVAFQLYDAGYQFIVFLPIGLSIHESRRDRLTRLYNRILRIEKNDSIVLIDFKSVVNPECSISENILHKEANILTVLVDAEILFSENKLSWKGEKSKLHSAMRYSNVNIAVYDYYFSLFAYLSGRTAECDQYIRGFQNNLDSFKLNICSRNALYDLFCRELDRGLGFFIESAPDALWSSKGYFNLVGGHHRTCFLVFREHRLIPVRISGDDFEKWCNRPCLERVVQLLRAHNLHTLYAPVPHPAFHAFPSQREGRLPSVYSSLYQYIGTDGLAGETVFDLCDDEGYYARLLSRLNPEAVTAYAHNGIKAAVTSALNELLYLQHIRVVEGAPAMGDFCSFLVLMDRAVGLSSQERDALMLQVDALCTGRMLWESYAEDFEADKHALYSQTGFTNCDIVAHIVLDGRRRTVAVFSKKI